MSRAEFSTYIDEAMPLLIPEIIAWLDGGGDPETFIRQHLQTLASADPRLARAIIRAGVDRKVISGMRDRTLADADVRPGR